MHLKSPSQANIIAGGAAALLVILVLVFWPKGQIVEPPPPSPAAQAAAQAAAARKADSIRRARAPSVLPAPAVPIPGTTGVADTLSATAATVADSARRVLPAPTRRDTLRRDSLRRDTVRRDTAVRDTTPHAR